MVVTQSWRQETRGAPCSQESGWLPRPKVLGMNVSGKFKRVQWPDPRCGRVINAEPLFVHAWGMSTGQGEAGGGY